MPRTIRFHLDEHCPHAIATGLRRHGIDVTTATDAGLLHAHDDQHVAFALADGRMIFTEDDDYLALNGRGIPHAGIAYCHQQTRTVGEIIDSLVLIWEIYEPEEVANRIEYL
jgi:predicted nuclease of predicted toxin-antitoxin system